MNIKDLSLSEAEDLFLKLNDKKYRASQLFDWLYIKNVSTFAQMTNFSKTLREKLEKEYFVTSLEIEDKQTSKIDGTVKYLFKTNDNLFIESVLLKNNQENPDRITICVSSQIGCAMGCTFCHTANLGFKRNLSSGEIIDQISVIRRDSQLQNTNVVFMGMGEPLNNYGNVVKAASVINSDIGINISVRRITISTCGILPSIKRYLEEKQPFKLALSLNDSDPEKRKVTMPIEKTYPISEIATFLEKHYSKLGNRLTLEYVMRKDNISKSDAIRIKKMFKNIHIKLNLIPLNPGDDKSDIPKQREIKEFVDNLKIMNIPITIRKSLGSDIKGACGQLSGQKYNEAQNV